MKPLIISFFTPAYACEAIGLEESCKAFGLETDIRPVDGLGSWELNCGYKPAFIAAMMQRYPGRPIVWLDADARVKQQPALFYSLTCDFAAHWRHGCELLSGTMYFGATDRARHLASAWEDAQNESPDEWDQRTLQRVIDENRVPGLRIERLPSEYTRIFDDDKMGDAVIEHLQRSRELKQACFPLS